eukprot:COSAG06_NODE_29453_length_556_cov_0.765864_1_plen_21_part_10
MVYGRRLEITLNLDSLILGTA